jgi:hypothetical protein
MGTVPPLLLLPKLLELMETGWPNMKPTECPSYGQTVRTTKRYNIL